MKKPWQSKTHWVNLIIAISVLLIPGADDYVKEHPDISIVAGAVVNIVLRYFTKEAITLTLLLLFMSGCSSIPQKLDPDKFYKRDLPFCVSDIGCYEGTAVIPKKDFYAFEVAPKGDASVDMLVLDSCHREFTKEGSEKTVLGFFGKIFGKKKEGYQIQYMPIPGIEDDGDCTIRINTFEKDKGRHAWAVIRSQHEKYQLPATIYCNGEVRNEYGVSLCQSKAGLTQKIEFPEKVQIITDEKCELPKKSPSGGYEWKITHGECGYTVRGESGRIHDLLTIGFEGLLVRNQ